MTTTTHPTNRQESLFSQIGIAVGVGTLVFLVFFLAGVFGYRAWFSGRIMPGVSVAGVDLSGVAPVQAAQHLQQVLTYPHSGRVVFRDGVQVWVVTPADLGIGFDAASSAQNAYHLGRSGGVFYRLNNQVQAMQYGVDVSPVMFFDQRIAHQYLQQLAVLIDQPVVEASLAIDGTQVVAQPGQIGRVLNVDTTMVYLGAQLQTFRDGEVPLYVEEQAPEILDVTAQAETARMVLSAPLTLTLPNAEEGDPGPWTIDIETLAGLIVIERVQTETGFTYQLALNGETLRPTLENIAEEIDRDQRNARFLFDDQTAQLVLHKSAIIGRTLDVDATITTINEQILTGQHTIPLQVIEEIPAVQDSASAASLGVTELVSSQTSYYYGSSGERIHNIRTAASQFHGILIAPGETFSMGKYMGDISLENGYAEALIIYGGRTIKGVGGGVCQVSTTLFRTAFFGGFPIVERYAHAYRVFYYEQNFSGAIDTRLAGLDATVYFPLVDFKFTNDTSHWILMETEVNARARYITWRFYSTSDGRTVKWNTTGTQNLVDPPQPLFQENPELGRDEVRQIDWAAVGADVTVNRTVMRNGQVHISDAIRTHYRPWQAICEYGPGTEDPQQRAKDLGLCQP